VKLYSFIGRTFNFIIFGKILNVGGCSYYVFQYYFLSYIINAPDTGGVCHCSSSACYKLVNSLLVVYSMICWRLLRNIVNVIAMRKFSLVIYYPASEMQISSHQKYQWILRLVKLLVDSIFRYRYLDYLFLFLVSRILLYSNCNWSRLPVFIIIIKLNYLSI